MSWARVRARKDSARLFHSRNTASFVRAGSIHSSAKRRTPSVSRATVSQLPQLAGAFGNTSRGKRGKKDEIERMKRSESSHSARTMGEWRW